MKKIEEYQEAIKEMKQRRVQMNSIIQSYRDGNKKPNVTGFVAKASDLELRTYISPFFEGDEAYCKT